MATDVCNNISQCSQTVTVVDTTPPTITCVGPKTIDCGTEWPFDARNVTEVCDPAPVITVVSTITNSGCGKTLTAIRTWKATDVCSNISQCSQTVTISEESRARKACSARKTPDH